ncbi:M23 family metallopeptidase [Streptomyces parvulus]|uniref:M23 family metallopeptidase n=1 Tax=Streptomyces parvulus TaxID=146923 RepID=UPI00369E87F4
MNDRHPSGTMTTPASASDATSAHYASYGTGEAQYGDLTTYGGYDTTGFPAAAPTATPSAAFDADPLFGNLPGQATGTYDTTGGYDTTGAYDATQWSEGSGQPLYDPYAAQHQAGYDSGSYDATAWTASYQAPGAEATGQWDSGVWTQPDPAGSPADGTQQWEWGTQTFETGSFDTGAFATGTLDTGAFQTLPFDETAAFEPAALGPHAFTTGTFTAGAFDTGAYDATQWNADPGTADQAEHVAADAAPEILSAGDEPAPHEGELTSTGELSTVPALLDDQEEVTPAPRASSARGGSRAGARSRRRQPAKRSALLTIAVPSACVMSVAGIAAASVGGLAGDEGTETAAAATDPGEQQAAPVKPSTANNKLDTQLTSLAAGADDFADRASRTQERIDLKAEQAAEKKRAAEEAARKERLRPKFALPVAQHGLSAYYGQAGINWMSVHSGIDFPVSYGTTVMAATDGTVRTQYNSAYGNMMIVTAKDGTETWYCHLSSYQVPSGTSVKAGDAIAFSGNSGNSTGPHLHFEVRPSGGSAIDPLSWLSSHGLNPQ